MGFGGGRRSPAEAEGGRIEETAGTSEVGVAGGKERRASILFKLPGEANTNKQHRTALGGSEGEKREER